MTVEFGILGPKDTFTDLAAQKYIQKAHINPQKGYFSTISIIVMNVANGTLKLGIVPLKNSIGGPVKETNEALKNYPVEIIEKVSLPIQYALVALPEVTKENISTIASHPQSFKQCLQFMSEQFPQVKKQETASTMAAFEHIQKTNDHHSAAIIPLQTAEKIGANILVKNVSTQKSNTTTFIIIQAPN